MSIVISSVVGSFAHDSSVIASGSGFTAKATAAPIVWDNCSGTDPLDLWDGAWPTEAVAGAANFLTYRAAQRSIPMPHSRTTKYLAGCHNPGGDAEGGNNVMFWKNCVFSEGRRSLISWYGRLDDGWAFQDGSDFNNDNNLKHWDYAKGGNPYDTQENWYTEWFSDLPPANAGCPSNSYVNVFHINDDFVDPPGPSISGGGAFGQTNYVNPFAGAWVKTEMAIIYSSTNGIVRINENGVLKFSYTGPTDKMSGTARVEAIGGYARAQGAASQWRYFCDAYIDDCFNSVFLGNASQRGFCTLIEYQIPTAWADGSITFTANLGAFPDSGNAWLYIRDSNGNSNEDGFAVTLGASQPPPPTPTAPAPKKGRARKISPPLVRYVILEGDDKHYFRTESEARSFLEKRARTLYKRAKAVARKVHKIELPTQAQRVPLRAPAPIPRFIATGSESISALTQQINARIDAILANPEREADEDDADLARLLQ